MFNIHIIYYYYGRITNKRRSSPEKKSKSFVNEAVRWAPGPKEKVPALDGDRAQSSYQAAACATRTPGDMEQREITHVRSSLGFSDQDHQLGFTNLQVGEMVLNP